VQQVKSGHEKGFIGVQTFIVGCRHGNRDDIFNGPENASVRLKCGDNHFWVIQHHKFNGVACFMF
jgi:hypothetical protein